MRAHKNQSGLGLRRALRRQVDGQLAEINFSFFHSAVKQIDVTEKIVNERIGRIMIHFFRRAHLLDPAFIHQNHPVRHLQSFFLIMRDEDAGDLELVVKAA